MTYGVFLSDAKHGATKIYDKYLPFLKCNEVNKNIFLKNWTSLGFYANIWTGIGGVL